MFYALIPFSWSAIIVVRICHGAEYMLTTRTLFENSQAPVLRVQLILAAVFFGSTMVLLTILNYFPLGARDVMRPASGGLLIAFALFLAAIFLHYGMDRYMFRMRQESIRETVGRLLDPKRSNDK
jgi:hypothetical protein